MPSYLNHPKYSNKCYSIYCPTERVEILRRLKTRRSSENAQPGCRYCPLGFCQTYCPRSTTSRRCPFILHRPVTPLYAVEWVQTVGLCLIHTSMHKEPNNRSPPIDGAVDQRLRNRWTVLRILRQTCQSL